MWLVDWAEVRYGEYAQYWSRQVKVVGRRMNDACHESVEQDHKGSRTREPNHES